MSSARAILRLAVAVSVLISSSAMAVVAWGYGGGGGGSTSCSGSPTTTAFQAALPIMSSLAPSSTDATTDYYTLPGITMKSGSISILPGFLTAIWGYNGTTPGPTIKVAPGRKAVIKQTNSLGENTSVHLHGGHTPSNANNALGDDGGPVAYIAHDGGSHTYSYPNNQVAATLWYHDHAMDITGPHVYKGLAGFYLLSDQNEQSLNLPSGIYDVPLVIQDKTFNTDGSLCYQLDSSTIRQGFQGDTVLVNGAVQPYFKVEPRQYRLRFLNGSESSRYELSLSNGAPLIQIASDGGLLQAPVSRSSALLAPAEREEFLIDFSKYPGQSIVLNNSQGWGSRNTGQIMRFDVANTTPVPGTVPSKLATIAKIDPATAAVTRSWKLSQNNGTWVINDKAFDPKRIDAQPKLGTVEVWQFQNQSGEYHPIHIHDMEWQVVSEDGSPPPAWDAGWKDVFLVKPWSSYSVVTKFTDNTGVYVFHCHNLEHEDHAMMGQFQVMP